MWGSRPAVPEGVDLPPSKATMKLAKFTPVTSAGSLLALMRGPDGKLWLAVPSVKQTDRDGNPVIGDKGKPVYKNFIDFKDRATRDRFTEQVIGLIRNEHPDVIGDGDDR